MQVSESRLAASRWLRRAAGALGAIVVIWLAGWLTLPGLIKSQLEQRGSAALGRELRVGQVEFRPWTLELGLSDLRVAGVAGAPPLLQVDRIVVNAELESLVRLAPVIESVQVQAPKLRLTHLGDGRYDIDDLLERFKPDPAGPSAEPARFALYNLTVSDGEFDFDDRKAGRVHEVRSLALSLPFLSNLPSRLDIKVQPHLAFRLNGVGFDTAAEGTPFSQTRKGELALKFSGLNLEPYISYLPATLPVRLAGGLLSADLRLTFEDGDAPAARLTGALQASKIRLREKDGQDLLSLGGLSVQVTDVQPLRRFVRLAAVELTEPSLAVRRDSAGRINLLGLAAGGAAAPAPATAPVTAQPAAKSATGSASDWRVEVDRLALRGGSVSWADDSVRPRATLALGELTLDASHLSLAPGSPAEFKASAKLGGAAGLTLTGASSTRQGSATLAVSQWPLGQAAPYLRQFLRPSLSGQLDARASARWNLDAAPGSDEGIQVALDELTLDRLDLREGRSSLASVRRIQLTDSRIDLSRKTVGLGKLKLRQPQVRVDRAEDGRFMYEGWLAAAKPAPGRAPNAAPPAGQPGRAGDAWRVRLAELLLEGGDLGWNDRVSGRPVDLALTGLRLQARNLAWPPPPAGRQGPALSPVVLSARVGRDADAGTLNYKGALALDPLVVQGDLDARRLPLHAVEPYLGGRLKIELLHLDGSVRGSFRLAKGPQGLSVRLAGDLSLEDLKANTVADAATGVVAEELLGWKALSVRGVELAMAPGAATTVDVRETALTDFFARLIVTDKGRFNLQDLVRPADEAPASSPGPAAQAEPPMVVRVGPIALVNGQVRFSDRFIKPNYSADLSELTGRLSAFSTVPAGGSPTLADLELRGRAEGTASLEISGRINPLAQPLMLDIQGRMRDLELPPLTAYSIKYAGHGIERGKLSMDVRYEVQPDGMLRASNRLVLNQLRFGDPVQGAPASLPVRLAVALLADRNGVIDLDLPISGSLNDPQFSLGPIIFKVVVNLIVKAVTAPFALLANAFGGGGDEMGVVAFDPGAAGLAPAATQVLDKVASALQARPALQMTVVGQASLEAERDAFARERLRQWVLAEKRRQVTIAGKDAASVAEVSPAEYPALLKEVYRRADMPKPRNLVGMLKDLPPGEMEAMLTASVPVKEDDLRDLALRRGVAIKDYLAARGLPADRLFLGAAKLVPPEAKWSPRAELNLATP